MPPNRPTKKERREATKAARFEAERKARKQRRARFAYGGIGAAAVVGLIVALVLASGSSNTINLAALNKDASAAGCSNLTTLPDQGRSHIVSPQTFQYNSNPPTSGSHYNVPGIAPAPTGVHLQPVQDEDQVHNLEHGHIIIQYNGLAQDVITALESFTRAHDSYTLMAPRPQLPTDTQLAFTRWDQKITCAAPTNADAVVKVAQTFYNDFHGLGPEGALPGTPLSSG